MNRAQFLLIAILSLTSLRKFVGAEKVEQGHHDSHHEKDLLRRSRRYAIGRVPLSYLSAMQDRIDEDDSNGSSYTIDKRFRLNAIATNPAASHFRENQVRQIRRPPPSGDEITPAQLQAYKNLLSFHGNGVDDEMEIGPMRANDLPNQSDAAPLTDEELQTLLLLLDGYRLQGKTLPLKNYYTPPAQYYSHDMSDVGKRETGKRSSGHLGQEQPMSFENSLGDNYPLFLNSKRSKRVGGPQSPSSIRIKKETDPAVKAKLDKIFGSSSQQLDEQHHSTSIPTTAISSSDQIPPPSSSQKKPKKAINWSNYFGIDKRQDKSTEAKQVSLPSSASINHHDEEHEHGSTSKQDSEKSENTIASASTNNGSTAPAATNGNSGKIKEKKDKDREENDTEIKEDRKWILKEFYKNLAMSTNVKRKRELAAETKLEKLEKIEKKMEEAGDQIIRDALKYTGAHKDAELTPEELAHVKNEIIQKLSAAYSLEKVREAIEEFRQQLAQLKDKQQYY